MKDKIILFVGKTAKLSSQYLEENPKYSFEAEKAVDGVYNDKRDKFSMAHSQFELRPWWRVDLVDVYCVWAVNILNRSKSECSKLLQVVLVLKHWLFADLQFK